MCLQCRRHGLDPWVGKILWRWEWLPTPDFLPGEFHGEEPGGLQSVGSQRVIHDWVNTLNDVCHRVSKGYLLFWKIKGKRTAYPSEHFSSKRPCPTRCKFLLYSQGCKKGLEVAIQSRNRCIISSCSSAWITKFWPETQNCWWHCLKRSWLADPRCWYSSYLGFILQTFLDLWWAYIPINIVSQKVHLTHLT